MNEKKTVYRWWWVWNFEKEEQWLNEMAMQGWTLEQAGFCVYHFVKTEPGEYTIRLQMENDDGYSSFMEEIGAEPAGRCVSWAYYRRKTELGEFQIELSRYATAGYRLSRSDIFISKKTVTSLKNEVIV